MFESQQTENNDANINHLSQKVDNLSSSLSSLLQEEEAAEVQLSTDEHTDQATEQLLKSIKLSTQNARLEYELQEAEEQKQKAELEREATVVELKAKKDLSAQIYAQFCKLHYIEILPEIFCHCKKCIASYYVYLLNNKLLTLVILPPINFFSDEPPKVTNQPKSQNKVCPGIDVSFTIQATGSKPLSYLWQWKPAKEESGSEDWKRCPAEWSNGAILTIPNVQKSDEGYYCCVISNCAGEQTSCPTELSVGKNLRNNAMVGSVCCFTFSFYV